MPAAAAAASLAAARRRVPCGRADRRAGGVRVCGGGVAVGEVGAGAGRWGGGPLQAAARLRFIVEAKKEVKAALKARK